MAQGKKKGLGPAWKRGTICKTHRFGPEVKDEFTYSTYYRKKCEVCGHVEQREERHI